MSWTQTARTCGAWPRASSLGLIVIFPVTRTTVTPPESPVWSSQRLQLAFRDWTSLYTIHPEKTGAVSLGPTHADPAWSPDGEWIAWAHSEPGSIHNGFYYGATIYVARIDGSETRPGCSK